MQDAYECHHCIYFSFGTKYLYILVCVFIEYCFVSFSLNCYIPCLICLFGLLDLIKIEKRNVTENQTE